MTVSSASTGHRDSKLCPETQLQPSTAFMSLLSCMCAGLLDSLRSLRRAAQQLLSCSVPFNLRLGSTDTRPHTACMPCLTTAVARLPAGSTHMQHNAHTLSLSVSTMKRLASESPSAEKMLKLNPQSKLHHSAGQSWESGGKTCMSPLPRAGIP